MRADKKTALKKEIGQLVRALRNERDWKQQALAHMIGDRSHSTISEIENGRRMPSPATLRALAEVFDVSVAYLLGKPDAAPESTPETRALKASIRSELDVARSSLERAATLFAMFL
jgi:transcriptional regulator with XRE-family HTH domain